MTCHTPFTLRKRTYSPPPHDPRQKRSTYNSASVLFKFSPACETTKYPMLFGNLVSKSINLVGRSLGLTKTASTLLGKRKSAPKFLDNMLFRKKLARVIRDDCANQRPRTELARDFNDCANQD